MICRETSTHTGSLIFGIQESYKLLCDKLPFEDVLCVPLRFRIKGRVMVLSVSLLKVIHILRWTTVALIPAGV